MLGDLGTASLAAGVFCATLAALLWLRVAGFGASARPARIATTATLVVAAAACAILEVALLRHDFSVRYVAENGGRHVPLYYTLTSLWAALDGSLLLWLLVLGGYAVLLARRRYPARLHGYAMVVVSAVAMFFFALAHFAANPFRAVSPVPADGPGPNPLLQQHPAMGLHPPLLYAGYIGLVVPFAFALAAPLAGRDGRGWLRVARPWTLVAWAALTAGIGLGAWWSYAVLGWGGYWAWDPVENASLLPWLTATAFLHTATGAGNRRAGWNLLLASASFVLVLLGTFLTRSGAVTSVHAFTESPLGPMLLGAMLLAVLGSTLAAGGRGRQPVARRASRLLSRDTAVLINAVLLVTIAAAVLIGTIFPLLSTALGGPRTAIGPPYYQRTAVPLATVVLLTMGAVPVLRGRGRGELARRLAVPGAAGLLTVAVVGLLSRPGPAALTGFGAAVFVLTGVVGQVAGRFTRPRPPARSQPAPRTGRPPIRLAGLLAHAGLALVALGVAGSSAYSQVNERTLRVGETLSTGGVSVRLVAIERTNGAGVMAVRARLRLGAATSSPDGPADSSPGAPAGSTTATLVPALRYHPARDTAVTVPEIDTGLLRDTYVTLLAVAADSSTATVRLAVNPLVSLLWVGGALTAAGGLLAAGGRLRSRPGPGPARRDRRRTPAPVGTDSSARDDHAAGTDVPTAGTGVPT